MARLGGVRAFPADVERAENADEFAERLMAFGHWMETTSPAT
jgi:hypothetical protein